MQSFSFPVSVLLLATCCLVAPTMVGANDNFLQDNQLESEPPSWSRLRPGQFRFGGRGRQHLVEKCSSCGPNQCQVMGMQRYAEPMCDLLGGVGSTCRMWQEPENKTLHFPHKILQCDQVYMQFCPCSEGLVCEDSECKLPATTTTTANQRDLNNFDNFYRYLLNENDVPSSESVASDQEDFNGGFEAQQEPAQQEQQQQQPKRYSRGPQWPQYSWIRFN